MSEDSPSTEKAALDPEAINKALTLIKSCAEGNSRNPGDLLKFEEAQGEILKFTAQTKLILNLKSKQKTQPGRAQGYHVTENPHDHREHIDKAIQNLDRETLNAVKKEILKRPDKGFAQNELKIPLSFWAKDFVLHEPCSPCDKTGKTACSNCRGTGKKNCEICNGSGSVSCHQCGGSGQIQKQQSQSFSCDACQGQGRIGCSSCAQTGKVECSACHNTGQTTCSTCKGEGWNSQVTTLSLSVTTQFEYTQNNIPESVVRMIDELGPNLGNYASIQINPSSEETAENLTIKYAVALPYGHIEFMADKKNFYALLFGTKYELIYVSPFIDHLIKDGLRRLKNAAEKRGAATENIKTAATYRCIQQGVLSLLHNTRKEAAKHICKTAPFGLSTEAVKDIVVNADTALKNITRKPSQTGFFISMGCLALFYALYFLLPMRNLVTAFISGQNLQMAFDLALIPLGGILSIFTTQAFANRAAYHVLRLILPKDQSTEIKTKIGFFAPAAFIGSVILFLFFIELSRHVTDFAPLWAVKFWPSL